MKTFVVGVGIFLLLAAVARAQDSVLTLNGSDLHQLTTPSLKDMFKAAKSEDKREEDVPAKTSDEGGFAPYLGFTDTDPSKFLVAGQTLGMLGGFSYFTRKLDKPGEFGFTFAVKDNVPNRFMGYTLEKSNLVPYFSFSLSY